MLPPGAAMEVRDAPPASVQRSPAQRLPAACDRRDRLDNAVRLLCRVLDAAPAQPAWIDRAQIAYAVVVFSSCASVADATAGMHRPVAPADPVVDETTPIGSAPWLSVLGDLLVTRGVDGDPSERTPALAERRPDERRPSASTGAASIHAEEFDRAPRPLGALAARLLEHGEEAELAELLVHLARLECHAGNVARAGELADRGYELARLASSDSLQSHTRAMRALVYAHEGRVAETRAAATGALERAASSGSRIGAFWAFTALGLLERSLGNDEAVLAALAPSLRVIERDGVLDPAHARYLPDAIEALIHLGQIERAERLTMQLDERARALVRPAAIVSAARCRAMIEAARGDLQTALATLDHGLDEVPKVPVPLELARTLIVKGQLERRQRHNRQATESLQRALRICEDIGATLWARQARTELARLARRNHADTLTATEAQIARLAGSGLTTREVAASAFVSPKTVEANITRIYRKLGIHSRVQLANWLSGRADMCE